MNQKEPPLELIKTWIASVIEGINKCVNDDTKKEILENCGEACAIYHGHLEKIASMKEKGRNLEEILDYMNQEKKWCGDWIQRENILSSTCEECECPLVLTEIVKLSPTFCYCSRGFVKSVFEEILGKPVNVELKKAIGRGDEVCHFLVYYNEFVE
jgi:predicted hydrocarbon binding protein